MDKIINGLKQIKIRVDSGTITTVNGTETLLSKQLNELLKEAINYSRCSTQLPTEEEIKLKAKEETSFPKMCYPNEIIERSCCTKYIEGAEWMREQLLK